MDKKNSRLRNSITNMTTTGFVYIFTMLMAMLVRSFLSRTLGQEYVGLNGVLTSVITSFSIADLGVDSVFVFLLYQPLANRDFNEIDNLMVLFKRIYSWIGIVFLSIGLVAVPFLGNLIGKQSMKIPNVIAIYLVFLLNTGLSYFFASYRVILNADQKYYVISKVTFVVTIVIDFLQICFLVFFNNFLFYSILLLVGTVLINLIISRVAKHLYPLGNIRKKGKLKFKRSNTVNVLIKNTIGGISNKLGGIVVYGSDNILLANFETLKIVGMYSNYLMITQGITALLSKVISSVTASIGNLGAENNKKKNLELFLNMSFIMNTLTALAFIPLLFLFSLFIKLWVGNESVLPIPVVELISINCALQLVRYPALTYIDAFGLQWIQKWKSIVEATVNIMISLILLYFFRLGLTGVLLGTLCSNIFVVNWYEPYLVLKEVCDKEYKKYIYQIIPFAIFIILIVSFSYFILQKNLLGNSIIKNILFVIIMEILQLIVIFIVFKNNAELKNIMRIFKRKFLRGDY